MVPAYGEDGLTVWAIQNKLPDILGALKDSSPITDCDVFYRPSFGRAGGPNSAQFGEPDFVIVSGQSVHMVECKWDDSPHELRKFHPRRLGLAEHQILRDVIFAEYVRLWFAGNYPSWSAFRAAHSHLPLSGKPVPGADTIVGSSLSRVLSAIRARHCGLPPIVSILLYFHNSSPPAPFDPELIYPSRPSSVPSRPWWCALAPEQVLHYHPGPGRSWYPGTLAARHFSLVQLDYSGDKDGVFIPLRL